MRKTEPCKAGALLYYGLLVCALAAAQTPTIDQSLSMKSAQDAQISPDGRYVAYIVQQTNWEDNEFVRQIWVYMLATGERYQLTSGKKSRDRKSTRLNSSHSSISYAVFCLKKKKRI